VISVSYNFKTRLGRVVMPPLNCTDMASVIRFFQAIDPAVQTIQTVGDDVSLDYDTTYVFAGDKWVARYPVDGWQPKGQAKPARN
jgi:hypothetical protein